MFLQLQLVLVIVRLELFMVVVVRLELLLVLTCSRLDSSPISPRVDAHCGLRRFVRLFSPSCLNRQGSLIIYPEGAGVLPFV